MKPIFIILSIIVFQCSYAQDSQEKAVQSKEPFWDEIIEFPDQEPSFPQGYNAMISWAQERIPFPEDDFGTKQEITVHVSFIVEKNGKLSDIKIEGCTRDCNFSYYTISRMPRWKPGTLNGKPVRTRSSFQLNFTLN